MESYSSDELSYEIAPNVSNILPNAVNLLFDEKTVELALEQIYSALRSRNQGGNAVSVNECFGGLPDLNSSPQNQQVEYTLETPPMSTILSSKVLNCGLNSAEQSPESEVALDLIFSFIKVIKNTEMSSENRLGIAQRLLDAVSASDALAGNLPTIMNEIMRNSGQF